MEVTITWFEVEDDPCFNECKASQFWNPIVVQLMQSEPVIKHLILALSLCHRRARDESADKHEIFFFNAYSNALRLLATGNPDVSIVLIACAILCVLENFRQQPQAFLQHLNAGLRIMRQINSGRSMTNTFSYMPLKQFIQPCFKNFEANAPNIIEYSLLDPRVPPQVKIEQMKNRNKVPIPPQGRSIINHGLK